MTSHVKRMLSYPAFLGIMAIVVIIIIATVAVPSLTKLFNSLGAGFAADNHNAGCLRQLHCGL